MGKVKRSQVQTLLNTGTLVAPVWTIIGPGVTSGKISYNPKTTDETYIHEDSATITVDSYAPNMPIEAIAINGDGVFEFLDAYRKGRNVLEDCETEIVNVWLYKYNNIGYYYAEKQSVSIQMDDFGGDGGAAAKLNYTINFLGDPVAGFFKPAVTAAFYAAPILASLATLVLGGLTLVPLFATSPKWGYYSAATINASNTVTATAANGGTLVFEHDSTPFSSGATITWTAGLNIITIEATVGTEVFTYIIHVTKS